MKKFIAAIIVFFLILGIGIGISLLMAFPVMWCWNYTVAKIWSLPVLTWWQAWCLCFLVSTVARLIRSNNSNK